MFSVIFLLTLMVLDRTVMWGTTYTNVPFLTGFYNGSWNPNMGASQAAMFSSSAMIVAVSIYSQIDMCVDIVLDVWYVYHLLVYILCY